jgi:hypothetical protein
MAAVTAPDAHGKQQTVEHATAAASQANTPGAVREGVPCGSAGLFAADSFAALRMNAAAVQRT